VEHLDELKALVNEGKNVFITGGAGVGKSFLLRALIAQYELEGTKVAKLASTGMAASLITGQTLHSFFNLGICSHSFDLERSGKINIDKKLSKLLKQIDVYGKLRCHGYDSPSSTAGRVQGPVGRKR